VTARAKHKHARSWRLPATPVAACFVAGLLLSSCAGKTVDSTWPKEKVRIMKSLDAAYSTQAKTQEQLQNVQNRVLALETHSTQLTSRLTALEDTVQQLSRNTPGTRKRIKLQEKSNRDLVKKINRIAASIKKTSTSIEKRKAKLEKQQTKDPVRISEDEKNRYTAAYLSFKSGRYDEAVSALKTLVTDYPKGEYSDQAYYWLGESYQRQLNSKKAIEAYRTIVNKYPESAKGAAALMELGLIYRKNKRPAKTREALQLLLKRYPASPEAEQARSLLGNVLSSQQK